MVELRNKKPIMNKYVKRIGILFFGLSFITAQDTLTVMTYNILRLAHNDGSKIQYIKKVINYVKPDVVLLNEIEDKAGLERLLAEAFNDKEQNFSSGDFPSTTRLNNGVIYNHTKLDFSNQIFIPTVLRHINGYTFSISNAHEWVPQLTFFTAHLKASDGNEEELQRWEEAKELAKLVETKDENFQYILGGDFNIYGPEEKSYLLLKDSLKVALVDPLWDAQKPWRRNESAFRGIYSQSTRTENLGDGGSTGGLDDRFDFLLFSHQFFSSPHLKYLEESYQTIGNDGAHFNTSIIDGGNSAVPDSIAEALYRASDHMPVISKIVYTTKTATSPIAHAGADKVASIGESVILDGSQSYDPNGTIVEYSWVQTAGPEVTLSNTNGVQTVFTVPDVNRSTAWTFQLSVTDNDGETGTDFINVKVIVSGGLTITDIQNSTTKGVGEDCYPSPFTGQVVELTGIVTAVRPDKTYPNFFFQEQGRSEWAGLFAYVNKDYQVLTVGDEIKVKGDISEYYGLTEIKNIQSTEILSRNNEPVAVTIDAAMLQGGCSSWAEPFEGMLIRLVNMDVTFSSGVYNQWTVSDWSGSCIVNDYLYEGEWPTVEKGDHFTSIKGVVHYSYGEYKVFPRDSLDFNEPVASIVDALPESFQMLTNYPNPFNPSTTLEFNLSGYSENGQISLQIFDVNGRAVATLVDGIPQSNKIIWNGKNNRGQTLPAGIYFARLTWGVNVLTRKMVLVK